MVIIGNKRKIFFMTKKRLIPKTASMSNESIEYTLWIPCRSKNVHLAICKKLFDNPIQTPPRYIMLEHNLVQWKCGDRDNQEEFMGFLQSQKQKM